MMKIKEENVIQFLLLISAMNEIKPHKNKKVNRYWKKIGRYYRNKGYVFKYGKCEICKDKTILYKQNSSWICKFCKN